MLTAFKKIRIADAAGIHQIYMAAQQMLQALGQVNPATRERTRRLFVELDQKVIVTGLSVEIGVGRRSKQLKVFHAIPLA